MTMHSIPTMIAKRAAPMWVRYSQVVMATFYGWVAMTIAAPVLNLTTSRVLPAPLSST